MDTTVNNTTIQLQLRLYLKLRYVGQPEISQKSTIVRSCYDIACTSNVVEFLSELGCR